MLRERYVPEPDGVLITASSYLKVFVSNHDQTARQLDCGACAGFKRARQSGTVDTREGVTIALKTDVCARA